jgi:hypothetical protein
MIDYRQIDNNLIDAICILQVAFDKVAPDSAKQWQARATLLSAIAKLSRQVTTIQLVGA